MQRDNLGSIFLKHPVFIIDKLLVVLDHCTDVDFRLETETGKLSWAPSSAVGQCCLVSPHLLASEYMVDCTEMKASGS